MSNDDFVFTRDFSSINWKDTLQVNAIRTAFAGPIIAIFTYFNGAGFGEAMVNFFLFPIIYGILGIPLGLLLSWLSGLGVPLTGIFSAIVAFMAALGDPLTFILHKNKPELVPVEKYGFFNLVPIIFVLDRKANEH
jgi:hypothetical protein